MVSIEHRSSVNDRVKKLTAHPQRQGGRQRDRQSGWTKRETEREEERQGDRQSLRQTRQTSGTKFNRGNGGLRQ